MEHNRIFFTLILVIMAVSAHAGSNNESHDAQVPELIQAAQNGNLDTVNRLINAGSDLEVRNRSGRTPIMLASKHGYVAVVQALIMAGADPNASTTGQGTTALMITSHNGHVAVVRLLLQHHANPNTTRTTDGTTALMIASYNGHIAAVKLLLQHHADPNTTRTTDGVTALMSASQNGHVAIVRLLLQHHANPNAPKTTDGVTTLMAASQNGHVAVVRLLLQNDADSNAFTADDSWTALMSASFYGHAAVVRLLLQHDAAPNATRTIDSWTALMFASQNGHAAAVRLLLQDGANPNASTTDKGWTALMIASKNGHINAVRALIIAGANLNATTHRGTTASCLASHCRYEKIVTLLTTAEKYGTGAAQQPAQSLAEIIQEYWYRKSMVDEIELQYTEALTHHDQIADSSKRAHALREQLALFAEQCRQRLLQEEPMLKACKNLTRQFIEHGSPLTEAVAEPLLDSDSFENFHVKLITTAQSFSPTNVNNTCNKRLLEQYTIFGTLFGRDTSGRICKLALSRSDYRQLRALITQRDAQRSLSKLPAPQSGGQRPTNQSDLPESAPSATNAPIVASQNTYCTIL